MTSGLAFLWIPLGYVIGATPFGFLAGRLKGIDIRQHGSGNIGATNVVRVLGKGIGYPVFALDVLKGALPVWLARVYAGSAEPEGLVPVLTCLAAILGHNYTFWLGFKGGKGIATSAGALLPLIPVTILLAVAVWCATFAASRYVSVASMAGAVTLPLSVLTQGIVWGRWQVPLLVLTSVIAALAFWRHRANIRHLRDGTEYRFQRKASPKAPENA